MGDARRGEQGSRRKIHPAPASGASGTVGRAGRRISWLAPLGFLAVGLPTGVIVLLGQGGPAGSLDLAVPLAAGVIAGLIGAALAAFLTWLSMS